MKRNLVISFVFLAAMLILMRLQGNNLITPQSPRGIIDFELAQTERRFRQLLLFWDHETVLRNIYFNFLLIMAYAWFFVSACKAVGNSGSTIFSGLTLSAGAFDILENFLMVLVWNERLSPSLLRVIFYAAILKFLLLVIVVGFLILSLFGLFKKESSTWLIFDRWNISDLRQDQKKVR